MLANLQKDELAKTQRTELNTYCPPAPNHFFFIQNCWKYFPENVISVALNIGIGSFTRTVAAPPFEF